jgi:hypothetical protein
MLLNPAVRNNASAVPSVAPQRWQPPMANLAKINANGAVVRHGRGGTAAAICHDHNGLYLGSSAVVIERSKRPHCS